MYHLIQNGFQNPHLKKRKHRLEDAYSEIEKTKDEDEKSEQTKQVTIVKKKNKKRATTFALAIEEPMKMWLSPDEIQSINARFDGPYVHNVVATASLCFTPNVHELAWEVCGKHDANKFAAPFTFPIKRPRCTILVFPSGNVVNTGTRSPESAVFAMYRCSSFLREHFGYPCQVVGVEIFNMQATIYMNYTINLTLLNQKLLGTLYMPEIFNAVKYTCPQPKVTYLIFPSGSVVITGAKSREQLLEAAEYIKPYLAHCRLQSITKAEQDADRTRALEHSRRLKQEAAERVKQLKVRAKIEEHAMLRPTAVLKLSPSDYNNIRSFAEIDLSARCPRLEAAASATAVTRKLPLCQHQLAIRYECSAAWCLLGAVDAKTIRILFQNNQLELHEHFHIKYAPDISASSSSSVIKTEMVSTTTTTTNSNSSNNNLSTVMLPPPLS